MTTYIIFEHINDPHRDKPVEVHDCPWDAESSQLNLQQDKATAYNRERKRAFRAGCAVGELRTAAYYTNHFRIEEV